MTLPDFCLCGFCAPKASLSDDVPHAFRGLRKDLDADWEKRNTVFLHKDADPIPPRNSQAGQAVFAPKKCMKLGICVCSRNPKGQQAELFNHKFKSFLRAVFKKGSVAKRQLDANVVVLKFQQHPFSEHKPLYYHLGYCNCKTWLFTLLRMAIDSRPSPKPTLIPLRLADATEGISSLLDIVNVGIHEFTKFDLTVAWACQVAYLSQGSHLLFDPDDMRPHKVFVEEPMESSSDGTPSDGLKFLWRGYEEEKPQPKRRRTTASGKGPGQTKRPKSDHGDSGRKRAPQPGLEPEHQPTTDDAMDEASFERSKAEILNRSGNRYHLDAEDDGYEPSLAGSPGRDADDDISSDALGGDDFGSELSENSGDDVTDDLLKQAARLLDQAEADLMLGPSDANAMLDHPEVLPEVCAATDMDHKAGAQDTGHVEPKRLDFDVALDGATAADAPASEVAVGPPGSPSIGAGNVPATGPSAQSPHHGNQGELSDVSISPLRGDALLRFHGLDSESGSESSSNSSSDGGSSCSSSSSSSSSSKPNIPNTDVVGERVPDIRFDFTNGSLRWNEKSQNLVAHCAHHSNNCRRTRTTKASTGKSQGRPCGLLCAWLERAGDYDTAQEHSAQCHPTLEQRQEARRKLFAMPKGKAFADMYERPRRQDEDSEPK